jgi:hypothetical protein
MADSQDTAALMTDPHHGVIMPSAHHSVVAKARRYRSEPERVDIVAAEPLVAIVHGLHADHTVRHTEQDLVCSCERFRGGHGVCAHVLAVEHRRSRSAGNTSRSRDVHVPSAASTDGLATVFPEQR